MGVLSLVGRRADPRRALSRSLGVELGLALIMGTAGACGGSSPDSARRGTVEAGVPTGDAGPSTPPPSAPDAAPEASANDPDGAVPDSRPAPLMETFALLTYNVAGLPSVVSEGDPERTIPLISPLLNAYDLVLVQEDFSYHDELIAEAHHPYQSEPHPDSGGEGAFIPGVDDGIGDGLNRLSIFPFDGHRRVEWSECNGYFDEGSDCWTTKGYSMAIHELAPGAQVHVYNLHMDAGRGGDDQETRRHQIDQLMATVESDSTDAALIIAGDTNLKEEDEAVLADWIARSGLTDACRIVECDQPGLHDRVMLRSSRSLELTALAWRIDPTFVDDRGEDLSDHKAIAIEMGWRLR